MGFRLVETVLDDPPPAAAGDLRLLSRAAAILRLFTAGRPALRLSEVADAAALSRATTHRLLAGLCAEALLEKSRVDGSYRLGSLASELGAVALGAPTLRLRAQPVLARLAEETGETALMFQRQPGQAQATCIAQIESSHGLRLVAEIGAKLPLHAGGGPRAILAFLPPPEIAAVLAPLPDAAARRVAAQLAETRASGTAISFEETNDGVSGIGAPCFDARGQVLGSVALVGPLFRMDQARLLGLAPLLLAAAAEITAMQESRRA